MELRLKAIFFWTGIAALCFIGIPIHLKGDKRAQLESKYKDYAEVFNKSFDDNILDQKLPSFQQSLERIRELNSFQDNLQGTLDGEYESERLTYWKPGMPKYKGIARWGLTEFADLSPEEFKNKYLDKEMLDRILQRQSFHKYSGITNHHYRGNDNSLQEEEKEEDNLILSRNKRSTKKDSKIPEKVDWREKKVITEVKHQKNCGACWAFSTVQTMESMHAVQGGSLELLSVQQVIDCAANGNRGCAGGDTCTALEWMTSQKITTEDNYPLTLKDGDCLPKAFKNGVQVQKNFTCNNFEASEDKVLELLANHGPVVAAVDATNWQYYVGGIIQWNCDANNNHAVQIVGYDKTGTPPFYIVRNSWGPTFGDKGYLYIAIGSNLCGIAREISSVSVI